MQYIGITGFTNRSQVEALLPFIPPDLKLMVGVLVSKKTLDGNRVRLWRRYPRRKDIFRIFVDDPRCLNLVHYCADETPDAVDFERLFDTAGSFCHGFQFNGTWPDAHILGALRSCVVVLQVRPPLWRQAAVGSVLLARPNIETAVLLDSSGGNGLQAGPEQIAEGFGVFAWERERAGMSIGFAGGLTPDNLPNYAYLLRAGMSVDVESGVRDDQDGGGELDLEKCRRWIEVCVSALSV